MLKLYYSPSACSMAAHIALQEAGAQYEAIRLDFSSNEQRQAEFLSINPKGRVPALVTDQGVLTENPALLLYISQIYPEAALAPLDSPFDLARVQSFNSYLCSTVHVAHAHKVRGTRWADSPEAIAEMQAKVPETVGACFELIEEEMFAGPWVMGENFSICDIYLFTIAQWLEGDGVDTQKLPAVMEHRARMRERPAVQRVIALETGNS